MGISKHDINKHLSSIPSNYNMKTGHGVQDLKDFKEKLKYNAIIHLVGVLCCMPQFIRIILGYSSMLQLIGIVPLLITNLYCVILQRYNQIRINKVIKKLEPREEIKADKLRENLKNEYQKDYNFRVLVDKKMEAPNNFEDFLKNASYNDLINTYEKLKIAKRIKKENPLIVNDDTLILNLKK